MFEMLKDKKTILIVLLGLYMGLVFIPAGYFLYFSPFFNDTPQSGIVKNPSGKETMESSQTPANIINEDSKNLPKESSNGSTFGKFVK